MLKQQKKQTKEKVKINNIEISNTNEDTEEFKEDEEDEFSDIESQIAELEDDLKMKNMTVQKMYHMKMKKQMTLMQKNLYLPQ